MTAVDFASFVETLATHSGDAILPFFRTSLAALDKSTNGDFDPVTEADRAGEVAMRRLINANFPSHGIIGEEFGAERRDAEYVWVLDPIDGTKAFLCGLPIWGTLIGLTHNGRPVYGMMNQPFSRERFSGDGQAARYEGPAGRRTLRVRACPSVAEAVISTTHPGMMAPAERQRYDRLETRAKLSRYGGDCYAYAMLAAGHIDLVVESGLNPYDIVAIIPIVEGAGGVITSWSGEDASSGGSIIAASDRRVHEEALAILNS
ncbi:MAG: histidinol-phosphatase [Hyphomicrobiales bacterium]|nr:histidinol-phosphatase [Hyphomicrobiales bacterium]